MAKIPEFYKRLRELCEERNMTVNEFVKKLNLSSGSPTAWKNGVIPRKSTVSRMANCFGVSPDYLLGNVNDPFFRLDSYENEEKMPTADGEHIVFEAEDGERIVLEPEDIPLCGLYKRLTKEDQDLVNSIMYRLIKKQEKRKNSKKE